MTIDMETSAVKNLDEIQEDDPSTRPSRASALVLASLGGACVVLAAALLLRTPHKASPQASDPLGDLVAKAQPGAKGDSGIGHDITFPSVLSDTKNTTALEAVREGRGGAPGSEGAAVQGQSPAFALPPGTPTTPPPATDRLPVVPLPAQNVLAPQAEAAPSDTLTTMAKIMTREDGAETAGPGGPGAYQLQVSSFKTQKEADSFAAALRRRGHKAYVEPANVKGRGLWYRVRIGPFKYRHSAIIYRQDFEAKERMVTFIVDPPKTTVRVRDADDDN